MTVQKYCQNCGAILDRKAGERKIICQDCGFVMYGNPIPAVAAILLHGNNLIVVQPCEYTTLWGLPGGYVELGESLEEALIREVKEETNLDIEIKQFIGSYPLQRKSRDVIFVVFLAESASKNVKAGPEINGLVILPPEEAFEKMTGKLARKATKQWMINRL